MEDVEWENEGEGKGKGSEIGEFPVRGNSGHLFSPFAWSILGCLLPDSFNLASETGVKDHH